MPDCPQLDSFLADNYIHDNEDAGIAFFETYDSEIYDNTVEDCKYGIRLSLGAGDNKIYNNKFTRSTKYGMYTYKGTDDESDDRSKDNDGRPFNNVFERNTVTDVAIGVQVKESDDIVFKSECWGGRNGWGWAMVADLHNTCNLQTPTMLSFFKYVCT